MSTGSVISTFPFSVSVISCAMYSGSVAGTFQRKGLMLPASYLRKVESRLLYANQGRPTITAINKNMPVDTYNKSTHLSLIL